MKNTFNFLLILTLSCYLFTSCSKDNLSENDISPENQPVLKTIKDWGFSDDVIEDMGDHYLVDKDIVFYKNKKYASPTTLASKQRQHANSVTISDINIFLNPGMNADWTNASVDAINRWNAINAGLNLIITASAADADIQIMYDTHDPAMALAANVFGRGEFPSSAGDPGERIWVNPDFNACPSPVTQNMRITNVQHEIGHNLGLTHTNQNFGNLIPGTPSTDSQSVMNGGEACTIDNFSTGDITAVRFLFPPFVINGQSLLCSSETATFNLQNTTTNTSVNWNTSSNLQILSSNNTSVTVRPINTSVRGNAFIEAVFPTKTVRKNITVGAPMIDYVDFENSIGEIGFFCSSHNGNTYQLYPRQSGTTHQIRLLRWPSMSVVYSPSTNYTGNMGTVNYTPSPGWYVFQVRRTNSCGTSEWFETEVEYVDCSLGGGGEEF